MAEMQPPPLTMCCASIQLGWSYRAWNWRMEVERTALRCKSCFILLNQEGTEGLSVGALPSPLLEELA